MNRKIDYLRLSLTDRCNLNCTYCRPSSRIIKLPKEMILQRDEIYFLLSIMVELGIKKIRFTGGEPLVRKDFNRVIEKISEIKEIEDKSITTNGILFDKFADNLLKFGINRVNFSIDSLKEERFLKITDGGILSKVLNSLKLSLDMDFKSVKVNTVLMAAVNDDEVEEMVKYTIDNDLSWRFIEMMKIGNVSDNYTCLKVDAIIERLKKIYGIVKLESSESPVGNGPAIYYKIPGAKGNVGFITPISHNFCSSCNRLRLTADGKLRPCLLRANEIDILGSIRDGKNREEIKKIIEELINKKSRSRVVGDKPDDRYMYQIGG